MSKDGILLCNGAASRHCEKLAQAQRGTSKSDATHRCPRAVVVYEVLKTPYCFVAFAVLDVLPLQ